MNRSSALEQVYDQLSTFARRARELGNQLHPQVSLVEYTQLSFIGSHPYPRAADIAETWGIDKSTVSRQIEQMVTRGLIERTGERPGRRGQCLNLTPAGSSALAAADQSVRGVLVRQLDGWNDRDITHFASLLARFNEATGESYR